MEMGLFDHMNPELARMHPLAVVRAFEEEDTQQGSLIEEIAYRYGYINKDQLLKLAEPLKKNHYGEYLLKIANEVI
jgi:glucose-1-phosphate thymidylyltransferase